ncbi:MAG: Pyruvate kinase [Candidatus Uhrbacteria bacterium GW2011_GWF2_41_16]|uniref:Pyruvate kinase n=1 Tax=Candidatus Uhrbacteria bacterium GW2011_GWF2_41_16 TaxID=1618997 RepID=A0A0G0VGM2_9BACT|nr:MAG: Pyruvate kinase [Candidatus Uhrbacteria bacterium GW2011_GWF2_41_16]
MTKESFSKRTKIVCTIGPSSRDVTTLRAMIRAGMNVARLNFSHGTYTQHKILMSHILTAAKKEGEPVALLQDLQGPKIRLGNVPDEGVILETGKTVILQTETDHFVAGEIPVFPITYSHLHKDLSVSDRILIDDGLLELKTIRISDKRIRAEVVHGGRVTSHKGMNFPDSTLSISSLTEKDREDLKFGMQQGVDWVALSFVTSAKDIVLLRRLLKQAARPGQKIPHILAKIEKHEAITHFEEILQEVDGIMVARGDLGMEIPAEEVPLRQKEIVERCRQVGKPVIVATQMLDSMIRNPRPTRAEVSDAANAVIDHADAVMLSGESATGSYPVEAVEILARIAVTTESSPLDDLPDCEDADTPMFEAVMSHLFRLLSVHHYIHGIVASPSLTLGCERLGISRPQIPLFLASSDPQEVRQLCLRWGVRPFLMKETSPDLFGKHAVQQLRKLQLVRSGMRIAVVHPGPFPGFDFLTV